MNLDFSEEQQVLRDTVRKLCAEYSPIEVVRALEDDPKGLPDALWKQLGELGLARRAGARGVRRLGADAARGRDRVRGARPRARADAGLRVRACCARACCSPPGSDAQKQEWLPQHRERRGDRHAGVARAAERLRRRRACSCARDADGRRATCSTGTKRHVRFASAAARLLVLARTGEARRTSTLFLVDPQAPGVVAEAAEEPRLRHAVRASTSTTCACRPSARIGAPSTRAGRPGTRCMHDGIIAARRARDGRLRARARDHRRSTRRTASSSTSRSARSRRSRTTWPTPSTQLDGGKTLVYEAACRARAGPRRSRRLAPMAKLFACQTYRDVTAMCQQVWGGVGFTIEYDIQLYFRRAKQLQLTWWDTRHLEELIAADVLDR